MIKNFCVEFDQLIKANNNVIICLQRGNDLDTTSSALSLAKLLELNYGHLKKIKITQIEIKTSIVGNIQDYEFNKNEPTDLSKTIFITVDINSKRQLRPPAIKLANECGSIVQIDHHRDFEEIENCKLKLVLSDFCSCSEVIWAITKTLDGKRNKEIAEIIFFGLYGDSRSLLTENINVGTFEHIAELFKEGAEVPRIMKRIGTNDYIKMKIFGELINGMMLYGPKPGEPKLAVFNLTPSIVKRYYPINFKITERGHIKQRKHLLFPLTMIEANFRIETLFFIHYDLEDPFSGTEKYLYVVLIKRNKKIEDLLLKNDFEKHRNRFHKKIPFDEITKFLEQNEEILFKF